MNSKPTISALLTAFLLCACNAQRAPDRCLAVDAGDTSPKYELCLPDKATYVRPDASQNRVGVANGYSGSWLPVGLYEIAISVDIDDPPRAVRETQADFVSMMGMREIDSGSRKIYWRQKDRILKKLPDDAKRQSFGISVFEALPRGRIVSIEAAILKPRGFDDDPVGVIDNIVKRDINSLLDHVKVADMESHTAY